MKKKRIINIIFYIFILCIICFSLFYSEEYIDYFKPKTIKDEKTFKEFNKRHYVSLDMSNAKETRFAFESGTKIYLVKYENTSLIIELKNDTDITKKVKGELKLSNSQINEIKSKIILEEETDNIYDKYFTNANLEKNSKFLKIKFSILCSLLLVTVLIILYNLIRLIF